MKVPSLGQNKNLVVLSYQPQVFSILLEKGYKLDVTDGSIEIFLSKKGLYACIKALGSLKCPYYISSNDVFLIPNCCIMWEQANLLINNTDEF